MTVRWVGDAHRMLEEEEEEEGGEARRARTSAVNAAEGDLSLRAKRRSESGGGAGWPFPAATSGGGTPTLPSPHSPPRLTSLPSLASRGFLLGEISFSGALSRRESPSEGRAFAQAAAAAGRGNKSRVGVAHAIPKWRSGPASLARGHDDGGAKRRSVARPPPFCSCRSCSVD